MITMTTIVPTPMNMRYVLSPCPPLRTELADPGSGRADNCPLLAGSCTGIPAQAGLRAAGGISYVLIARSLSTRLSCAGGE